LSEPEAPTGGNTRGGTRGNIGNSFFAVVVGSILILFLSGVALLLLSNVWYLAQPHPGIDKNGWQLFLEGLRDPENHFAIKLSVLMSAVTALLAMVAAIPAAYALSRFRLPGASIIDTLLDLPIVVPPPVIGLSLLIFFSTSAGQWFDRMTPHWFVASLNWVLSVVLGRPIEDDQSWTFTTRGIVLAQFFVACSFGVRAVKATFDTIGTRHEDVARTLGCTRRQAFFRVVLPMARTGIVAGAVMTWARAIAEFGPVLFFCGATPWKTEVMPIAMFLRYSSNEIEKAVVLLVIMLMISTITLLTFKRLGGKGYLW
jgi:molybdate transport system permease protein